MQIFGCFFENYIDFIAIMRDFHLSSFSGRYYRPLFPSPPFAARPLHPPRLADRAAPLFLSFLSLLPSSFEGKSEESHINLEPAPNDTPNIPKGYLKDRNRFLSKISKNGAYTI